MTTQGRIIRSLSGFYEVETASGPVTCRGRASLRRQASPLTGDLVEITVEHGKGMVEKILPRRNRFIRPAVANVDALAVFAANVNPVTEPFLIDRVAAIAADQQVSVYILVNKCDLDAGEKLAEIYRHAGFPVIQTSAETGQGIEELRSLLTGKLTAFTGNSGVGKSSLLNALDASFGIATGAVSERLGRGKHTTRHVELYALGADTFVADTPGFASFEVDMVDPISCENLQYAFREFRPYIGQCRFRDCAHLKEPGCAVLAAVAAGRIAPERHESYARLYALSAQVCDWEKKK